MSTGPASGGFTITPDDAVDIAQTTRGIYVGVSGDLKVTLYGGDTVMLPGIAGGVIHGIGASRVWATGTTAENLVGLY